MSERKRQLREWEEARREWRQLREWGEARREWRQLREWEEARREWQRKVNYAKRMIKLIKSRMEKEKVASDAD